MLIGLCKSNDKHCRRKYFGGVSMLEGKHWKMSNAIGDIQITTTTDEYGCINDISKSGNELCTRAVPVI